MNYTQKTILAVLIISILFSCSPAQATDLPKIAKLLPPQTVLLVETENFNQLKEQFQKTSIYKLYKDPAMAAFVKNAETKWQEMIKDIDNKNDILKTVIDANILPEGKVAFAMIMNNIKEQEPPILFISEWGKNSAKIKEAVDKMIKKAIDDGIGKKTEDYKGVTIVTTIKELPPIQVPDHSNFDPEQKENPTKTFQPEPIKTYHCFIVDV